MINYNQYLATKTTRASHQGFSLTNDKVNPMLFDFQRDIVLWAIRQGRAAIFADCGLGKTFMQIEWAKAVRNQTNGNILILAPLAVAEQSIEEGEKLGVELTYRRSQESVEPGITIANYEMLHAFDPTYFTGVVLDESSIIKHFDGKLKQQIIESFQQTPYRLACTATPAPNDYMELGSHSEFLGVMSRNEMLSMFFVHDGGETSKWRLKGHAREKFWKWVCSWAVMVRKPSDIGYSDNKFILPPLKIHQVTVKSDAEEGFLFPMAAQTLSDRLKARRSSISERVQACEQLVNKSKDDAWVIWCNLNGESEALWKSIQGSKQITGSEPVSAKRSKLIGFARGEYLKLVSKPSIAGHGMNWQHCHKVAFVGLSDSWEQYYQSVRRVWRFGQLKPVDVYIITSEAEGEVVANIMRKERDAAEMAEEMSKAMGDITKSIITGTAAKKGAASYKAKRSKEGAWEAYHGDCVEVTAKLEDESIDFSIFSPPFASLYTYSGSDRDMGNCTSMADFSQHFEFLVSNLGRVIKPGRLVAVHCFDIPSMKERDGVIGLKDFSNQIRIAFESAGFIYHSRVTIWKDPVTQMQRTKSLGLLHKQVKKDSSMSRQGLPDYLIVMRKNGDNPNPITHTNESFPVDQWQEWASPVWMNINPSNTLQYRSAREHKDERHICPLQLEVIQRAILLWSNKGDTVLSPFMGIGSEGYVALQSGRKFIGIELKESYYKQAVANLHASTQQQVMMTNGSGLI